jgi:transposase-like protein
MAPEVRPTVDQIQRRQPGDKWPLDGMFLTIYGEQHYLWRAVDQEGHVLDILVPCHRDKVGARKFFGKLDSALAPHTRKIKEPEQRKKRATTMSVNLRSPLLCCLSATGCPTRAIPANCSKMAQLA